jgi:hypothetical protein
MSAPRHHARCADRLAIERGVARFERRRADRAERMLRLVLAASVSVVGLMVVGIVVGAF